MKRKAPTTRTFKDRDAAIRSLLSVTHDLVKKLRSLPVKEKQAVVGLLALSQFVGVYARSRARPDETIICGFHRDIGVLSPEVAARLDFRGHAFACRDESIAYATAMARCLEDGKKTEDRCELENEGEMVAELLCVIKQIEAYKGIFETIFGAKFPPGPQPKPI